MSEIKEVSPVLKSVKAELNKVSSSFCIAKWKQVTLHLHNGRTHSCHHPYPHVIPLAELKLDPSALHNTEFKKEQRRLMLEGLRPKECQYCWNVEDLEGYTKNEFFSDRVTKSAESWAIASLEEIKSSPLSKNFNPTYLEVSFSNLCNFKCSYCSPVYSSKWQEEIENYGPYKTSTNLNSLEYFKKIGEMPISNKDSNPYVDAFWSWWPNLVKSLHVFRITGGEPLLNDNTFKILDYILENPQPNLNLAVNTNGSAPEKLINIFINKTRELIESKKINSLQIYTSLDGYGPYAEYGRHGLNYQTWHSNTLKMLNSIPQVKVGIMCTTNIFSIPDFQKFIIMVYDLKTLFSKNRITVDTNILRFPHHQNLSILTDDLKTSFDASLEFMKTHAAAFCETNILPGFYSFEINRLERLVEYIKSGPNPIEKISLHQARADFFSFVNEHDKRRGTDFLKTFPALSNFYTLCGASL